MMYGYSCEEHQKTNEALAEGTAVCDFSLASGEFSWVNEETQHFISSGEYGNAQESQLYQKKTRAECRLSKSMKKGLLGGRNCTDSTQCLTYECNEEIGKCVGRKEDSSCFSHTDCDKGMFCQEGDKYPYLSQCKKLRTPYDACKTTD